MRKVGLYLISGAAIALAVTFGAPAVVPAAFADFSTSLDPSGLQWLLVGRTAVWEVVKLAALSGVILFAASEVVAAIKAARA